MLMSTFAQCCCGRESKREIPVISSTLTKDDLRIRRRLRLGIGRNNTSVNPGLYKVGNPDGDSPVFVSSNYRMSFDYLRSSLPERNFWILVLDTKGINVWCAAGKGTFGTEEIIRRTSSVNLAEIVNHKTLILPQLGAPGVEAHVVKKETGFKVLYGPVRSEDLPAYLDNGFKTTDSMRTVKFDIKDRAVLIPLEILQSWKLLLVIIPYVLIFHLLQHRGINSSLLPEVFLFPGSVLIGAVLTPLLLPWIPGRPLSLKGWILGALFTAAAVFLFPIPALQRAAYFFLLPVISSFISLNFTGATTYTSLSGVKKEMRIALPLLIASAIVGTVLLILTVLP